MAVERGPVPDLVGVHACHLLGVAVTTSTTIFSASNWAKQRPTTPISSCRPTERTGTSARRRPARIRHHRIRQVIKSDVGGNVDIVEASDSVQLGYLCLRGTAQSKLWDPSRPAGRPIARYWLREGETTRKWGRTTTRVLLGIGACRARAVVFSRSASLGLRRCAGRARFRPPGVLPGDAVWLRLGALWDLFAAGAVGPESCRTTAPAQAAMARPRR